jgi:hypothetical protein
LLRWLHRKRAAFRHGADRSRLHADYTRAVLFAKQGQ